MFLEDNKEKVNRYLIGSTDFLKVKDTMSEDQLRLFVVKAINALCSDERLIIDPQERLEIVREIVSAVVSMGPIRSLMEDNEISEIMVNGYNNVYIQKYGRITLTNIKFNDNQHLLHVIQKLLGLSGSNKRVDESSPYVDFSLPDGSRVNVIISPCSMVGPVMTIRKFSDKINTVEDLIKLGMLNEDLAKLLTMAMEAKLNVVFCGATGSGKTTALNVFSRHIPEEERIITIEDTPELRLLQKHVVGLCSKPVNIEGRGEITLRDLFINSLRMRPDRIIMGEVRGPELLDLIQSISSGHTGSLAIIHAESPQDCFNRMVTMMLMTGIQLNTMEINNLISRAVDIIAHVELFLDGKRRVTAVTDVVFDPETKMTHLKNIFEYIQHGISDKGELIGEWKMDRSKPSFYDKFVKRMINIPKGYFH